MNRKKILVLALALVTVCVVSVTGTLAYLQTQTNKVINTFTYGDINITLTEDGGKNSTGMEFTNCMPGSTYDKDPVVTVVKGSEDCYLFIKVEKSDNFDTFMTFAIDDSWTLLDGKTDIYYRTVDSNTSADQAFAILQNNQVSVKTSVTKEMVNAITSAPTLSFQAYAVQKANIATVADAWAVANQ